jgi:collagen type VII alpha
VNFSGQVEFKGELRRRSRLRAAVYPLIALAGLFSGLGARGQQATLVGDAHVSSAQPTVNSGGLSNLNVGGVYTALVRFDLGTLPAGTTPTQITRATLRVYCNRADVPGAIAVESVGGAWTELGVTYATQPVVGAMVQTAQVAGAGEFVTFDVTSAVQVWVGAPATNNGLALVATGGAVVQFDSKENDQTSHAPELNIVLAAGGSGMVGATGATGGAGATGVTGAAGAMGPQGLVGATGAIGAAGAPGVNGLNGATGAQGPAGPAGSGSGGGIAYQGMYQSGTNYAAGDVVEWAGSSWVSLMSSNAGNTPGLVAGIWGMLASVGAAGAVGATGANGVMGPQGLTGAGVQGATGAAGATGTTGAAGLPGLVYRGAYDSTANYLMGDVVVWAGSSWASLVGFNVGQTPGNTVGSWGILTAQGPVGSTGSTGVAGPVGAAGALGPVGPPGELGVQGAQGIPGQAGAQGIPGTTGALGLQGPMGPQGGAGPVGLNFVGAYDSTANYALADGVMWQGAGWVSLIAGNHGNTPSLSPVAWALFAASGSAGLTGATGATGSAGVNGLSGAAGPIGAVGATGATGVNGTAGLVYRGGYASGMNYVLGDVVVWQGASWVSLVGMNVGQTPDSSSVYWGVLTSTGGAGPAGVSGPVGGLGPQGVPGVVGSAGTQGVAGPTGTQGPAGAQGLTGASGAVGSAGAQGLQGVAGASGAQGLTGVTGATGLQGPMGSQGLVGDVGMSFQGTYDSTANYAAGAGVLWQGAGWVSLVAGNRGNTPSSSPSMWEMFSAPGAIGAQGTAGPTGATGAGGANGLPGTMGPAGATGAQGFQGVAGPAGSAGIAGPVGMQGPAGAQGLTGPSGATGSAGPQGAQGVAGSAGAQGIAGATGAVGLQGATGATGAAGVVGPAGASGTNGLNGTPGMLWQGAWSSGMNYAVDDAVSYGGTSYLSVTAGNVGQRPDVSPANWAVLAQAGSAGAGGAVGATGGAGVAGPAGAAGSVGATGATGAAGAAGISFRGVWNAAANYAVKDGVTFAGSTYLAVAAGSNAEPDLSPQAWAVLAQAGGSGPTGAQGVAATLAVGTVTTLAAGSTATVTDSGTAGAAVLNFGIPQGAAGTGGSGGTGSGNFAAMYHPVSFNTVYYAVNSPNASATEASGAVLAWVPLGCTATRLDVYSQQSGAIAVTLRAGPAGSISDTTLTCSPSTNGSCTALGSVAIAAGEFMDFRFSATSGVTAGVWTALQCQ